MTDLHLRPTTDEEKARPHIAKIYTNVVELDNGNRYVSIEPENEDGARSIGALGPNELADLFCRLVDSAHQCGGDFLDPLFKCLQVAINTGNRDAPPQT